MKTIFNILTKVVVAVAVVFALAFNWCDCGKELRDDSKYNNSLFPIPHLPFISETNSFNCFHLCLSTSQQFFECKQCIFTATAPDGVDRRTFCCFYYQQMTCTFDCLTGQLNSDMNLNLTANSTEFSNMATALNQSLVRLETSDECADEEVSTDCDSKTTPENIKFFMQDIDAEDLEEVAADEPKVEKEPIWEVVLIGIASLVVAVALFVLLVLLTNRERKHFLSLKKQTEVNDVQSDVQTI